MCMTHRYSGAGAVVEERSVASKRIGAALGGGFRELTAPRTPVDSAPSPSDYASAERALADATRAQQPAPSLPSRPLPSSTTRTPLPPPPTSTPRPALQSPPVQSPPGQSPPVQSPPFQRPAATAKAAAPAPSAPPSTGAYRVRQLSAADTKAVADAIGLMVKLASNQWSKLPYQARLQNENRSLWGLHKLLFGVGPAEGELQRERAAVTARLRAAMAGVYAGPLPGFMSIGK